MTHGPRFMSPQEGNNLPLVAQRIEPKMGGIAHDFVNRFPRTRMGGFPVAVSKASPGSSLWASARSHLSAGGRAVFVGALVLSGALEDIHPPTAARPYFALALVSFTALLRKRNRSNAIPSGPKAGTSTTWPECRIT